MAVENETLPSQEYIAFLIFHNITVFTIFWSKKQTQPWWAEETSFKNVKKSYQPQTFEQYSK